MTDQTAPEPMGKQQLIGSLAVLGLLVLSAMAAAIDFQFEPLLEPQPIMLAEAGAPGEYAPPRSREAGLPEFPYDGSRGGGTDGGSAGDGMAYRPAVDDGTSGSGTPGNGITYGAATDGGAPDDGATDGGGGGRRQSVIKPAAGIRQARDLILGDSFVLDGCGSTFNDISLCSAGLTVDLSVLGMERLFGRSPSGDELAFAADTDAETPFEFVGDFDDTAQTILEDPDRTLIGSDPNVIMTTDQRLGPAPGVVALLVLGLAGISTYMRRKRPA